ncbi:M23 family metallopeptidase [Streptomyces sp. CB01373]|uniref:M23 family metallopeptidase n=1 Tax=Streptomyces sp. CB01373 TaxID=2020325 RepID=UPI000C2743D0|nr:M23 family metallopeptidase [Streptomyces sp. CB01373]PJM94272.1 peptidase M23 [Streptomyces sp. CB01373]
MPVSHFGETCGRLSRPHTAGYSHRTALPAPVVEAKEKLVNDRHPSGSATAPAPASDAASTPYASYNGQEAAYGDFTSYGDYGATGFHTGTYAPVDYAADHLHEGFTGAEAHTTGTYDTTGWTANGHQSPDYDPYAAQHHTAYDTGAYDTTAWATGYQQLASVPAQSAPVDTSGQWDAHTWLQPDQTAVADATQQWDWNTQTFDTGAYDATQWNGDATTTVAENFDAPEPHEPQGDLAEEEPAATVEPDAAPPLLDDEEEVTPAPPPAPRAASRAAGRSRRRPPAKRSALLTVAVPSVCVMGVAGIAAASVGGLTEDGKDSAAATPDAHPVKASTANNKLDTQLQSVSAGANDFADRASRYQERIDLKAQQESEKKKAAEEAARLERLRPKFAVPVLQRGLSAYFGQAGVNWMSVHTGIDFPVSYGTSVLAATDGTVRTQWNSAYGNMMIVTAMDGTETWYCHLSSYQVPSGTTVKAGQPIAYSGNSGNSTGPHLHFEVRPAGGSPIDPLSWLRSHGLDPT